MNTCNVTNPYNNEIIKTLFFHSETDIEQMLQHAHRAYQNKNTWLTPHNRIEILESLRNLIKKNRQTLAELASQEGGKPLTDSIVEIDRGIEGVSAVIGMMKQLPGRTIPMNINRASMNKTAYTVPEPKGVVLAISAFNHPFNLCIHQLIPAIAAGCPALIKPALETPLSCLKLVSLLYKAGLPKEWCQVMITPNKITEKIVQDSRISHLNFIGSAKVGWKLKKLLPNHATCTLEHGGAAPLILDKDILKGKSILHDKGILDGKNLKIDPELIKNICKASFYHAGQVCVSTQRIFVHKNQVEEFIEALATQAKILKVGDPLKNDTDIGPLIRESDVMRVENWVNNAINNGAQCVVGGKILSNQSFEPTILRMPERASDRETEQAIERKAKQGLELELELGLGLGLGQETVQATHQADYPLYSDEIFGPVVCIYAYEELEQAFELANNSPYCFQSSFFSNNFDNIQLAIKTLDATTVLINEHTTFRVDWMPFGGRKESGFGMGGLEQSIKDLTVEKLVVLSNS